VISRDIVIVGSGPAGAATALHLLKIDPTIAGHLLLLDKATHPREKTCAGGLIPHTLDCLNELDIPFSIPHVRVNRAIVHIPLGPDVRCDDGGICSVVRRNEFDSLLVQAARQRGVEVREGEKVLKLTREHGGVVIETEKETYRTRVVVGADGSGSRVRRELVGEENPAAVGKALMCDVPVEQTTWDGFLEQRFDFNFHPVAQGLKGYLWEFPCLIGSVPHVNVGLYALGNTPRTNSDLQRLLVEELESLGIQGLEKRRKIRAFPIYGYSANSRLAAPHVVLVGDAAGAEPLMGEGISFAFEYGKFAAHAIVVALRLGRYDFSDYTENLARLWVGKKLQRLEWLTRCFYGSTWWIWFRLAARSHRLQSIGLKWYNGVDGWDQRSGWEAAWTILRPRLSWG
jgi:geranylgeranyl reductase family protein